MTRPVLLATIAALGVPLLGEEAVGGRQVLAAIGIGSHKNPAAWKEVKSAEKSAQRVVEVIPELFGYRPFESPLLGPSATLMGINTWLERLVAGLAAQDDLVLYFAGHGVSLREASGEGAYLVPFDAPAASEADSGGLLKIDSMLEKLDQSRARNVLVILDACGSGVAIPSFRGAREASDQRTGSSRILITSAGPGQSAVADGGLHGATLFSGIFLDLLETGACDVSAEGYCTATDIALLARRRVTEKARYQTPLVGAFGGDYSAEFRLTRYGPAARDWAAAKVCNTPEECADTTRIDQFLRVHPSGVYAVSARKLKRERLEQAIRQYIRGATNDLRAVSGNGPRQSILRRENENDKGSVYLWIPDALSPFWMGKFEVSVDEYRRFTRGVMPRAPSFNRGWRKGNQPMVNISWQEARAYCNSIGGDLPTIEQWARAGHAGENYRFPWRHDEAIPHNANLAGMADGSLFPADVDSYQGGENVWQLRNLIGNVSEWTATPGESALIKRAVVAGGSFATRWRSAGLGWRFDAEVAGSNTVGFRCAVVPGS